MSDQRTLSLLQVLDAMSLEGYTQAFGHGIADETITDRTHITPEEVKHVSAACAVAQAALNLSVSTSDLMTKLSDKFPSAALDIFNFNDYDRISPKGIARRIKKLYKKDLKNTIDVDLAFYADHIENYQGKKL